MTTLGLQAHGAPLTDRFPAVPTAADAAAPFRLAPEQLAAFEKDGFVSGLPVLDAAQLAGLREAMGKIVADLSRLERKLYEVEAGYLARPDAVVLHALGAWMVDEWFHDLVFHPAVTVPVAQALGTARLRFWHDQIFAKPPRHPGVVPWHQDYSYWTRTGPPAHLTMYVALDDTGPDNGGIEYVPGSHRCGLLAKTAFDGPLDALLDQLSVEQRQAFQPRPMVLRAGEGAIHHSHLIHGSRANASDRPRRACVLNYFVDGTRVVDGSQPLLRGVPEIPVGEVVRGAHFPVVLDL